MKFKYYLRGAGVGMIIATVILSIAFLFHRDLSDAEIMKRAMALGMVMEGAGQSDTLADSVSKKNENIEKAADDPESEADQTYTKKTTADLHDTATDETPDTSDAKEKSPAKKEDGNIGKPGSNDNNEKAQESDQATAVTNENDVRAADALPEAGQIISIVIQSGDVSRVISARLQSAGLVEDAADFNDFLGKNGYDRLLHTGTYEITAGSTYEQIAEILTSR